MRAAHNHQIVRGVFFMLFILVPLNPAGREWHTLYNILILQLVSMPVYALGSP